MILIIGLVVWFLAMQRNIQVQYRISEMALRLNEDKEVIENGEVYQLKEWLHFRG